MLINNVSGKNGKLFCLMAIASLCLTAGGASAQQDAPSAPEDGALVEAQVQPPEAPMPVLNEVDSGSAASSVKANVSDSMLPPDPCPMPSAELAQAPDDLAKIQGDIDRYTLCMERAQLLQRLNDVAMENQKKLNEANGVGSSDLSGANPGMMLGSSFDSQRQQIMATIDQSAGAAVEQAPPPAGDEWYITKILGASGTLAAQLSKSDGTIAFVKAGDSLPGGGSVDSITSTSVKATQDGTSKTLRWRDNAGSTGL